MIRFYILILICCQNAAYAQTKFIYKDLPDSLGRKYLFSETEFLSIKDSLFKNSMNMETYLPQHYSKNGDIDYTKFLQKGIDENKIILMPDFPVLINEVGLKLNSESRILFQKESKLIIIPNDTPWYHGILFDNIENVDLYFPNIVGDKYLHKSSHGQWGMGIWINQSENIKIYNPIISKCWGDGIYIGNKGSKSSKNIFITNAFLDDNRRNGISITSGINVFIKNALISNTSGQNPRSGIDIEPNSNRDIINNIVIDSTITFNNAMHGIVISSGNLAGIEKKIIYVEINNFTDYYSTIGMGISITRANLDFLHPLEGAIYINNANFFGNSHSAIKNYHGAKNNVFVFLNGIHINLKKISENTKRVFETELGDNLDGKIK